MNDSIFRKKSIEKVKSPESLDDYIQVSNPGVWLVLVSAIVLLAGACIWGVFGHIDSTVDTNVHVSEGTVVCYIEDESAPAVQPGMTVRFDSFEALILEINYTELGYSCLLRTEETVPDGIYKGKIVTGTVRPLSFVLN